MKKKPKNFSINAAGKPVMSATKSEESKAYSEAHRKVLEIDQDRFVKALMDECKEVWE